MSENPTPDQIQLDLTFDPALSFDPAPAADVPRPAPSDAKDDEAVQEHGRTGAQALQRLVEQEGLDPGLVDYISRMAVRAVLASLHKEALMNERETHGLLHYCLKEYGAEACFHLCGILELAHRRDPGDGWATLEYALPQSEWEPFRTTAEGWMAERSEERKDLDESREDKVWEQEVERVRHHPEVDLNGRTFLESLMGRPTLAKSLVKSGTLLEATLERQEAANNYWEHQVLELHQDPDLAQMEAEREYLRIPDEATAPNLLNWDSRSG